jgi:hypothetical protein
VSRADPGTFEYVREAVPPLRDAKTWVLTGRKPANDGCQYRYPIGGETEIPADGWALRVIAVDMSGCRKLMEEGTPTQLPADTTGLGSTSEAIGADSRERAGARPVPRANDLAASKLAAGREKDLELVGALLDAGLIGVEILAGRVAGLPRDRVLPGFLHRAERFVAERGRER